MKNQTVLTDPILNQVFENLFKKHGKRFIDLYESKHNTAYRFLDYPSSSEWRKGFRSAHAAVVWWTFKEVAQVLNEDITSVLENYKRSQKNEP